MLCSVLRAIIIYIIDRQYPINWAAAHENLEKKENPEVYFFFVSNIEETIRTLNIVQNNQKHKDNRLYFVFKKGNKAFGRDHIYNIVMKHKNIKSNSLFFKVLIFMPQS